MLPCKTASPPARSHSYRKTNIPRIPFQKLSDKYNEITTKHITCNEKNLFLTLAASSLMLFSCGSDGLIKDRVRRRRNEGVRREVRRDGRQRGGVFEIFSQPLSRRRRATRSNSYTHTAPLADLQPPTPSYTSPIWYAPHSTPARLRRADSLREDISPALTVLPYRVHNEMYRQPVHGISPRASKTASRGLSLKDAALEGQPLVP